MNLVGNALKFTASGWVSVEVSGEPEAGAWKVTIEVQDTGIGIPVDKQRLLFQEFMQAEESTARKFGGTGLGHGDFEAPDGTDGRRNRRLERAGPRHPVLVHAAASAGVA